ncbi:alanyl-tRNA synthetase [Atopostipes suicloacalis DSM 15692]|uniref:Alanine--tRNA ligase n=1 Tax=Atopostipes suicloacalis DSM 15692 TaxID=1121025 RepID=A0A1M4ZQJ4_9LACT|nr:alanine--tRNA ligase [Atopostipes suicloacalis]SHF19816.1 alanyl-tRNA synthetase [Atopostipes suicloacalis DSM 15692]
MKKLTSSEIRSMFLEFFEEKGHKVEKSASLVPVDDPSLLWINSGVATFKKYFDGSVIPENPRITSSQKSIRTNDIENVGLTARHHTMFEMLGNFSIGDYFKEEAIEWAWEFLTDEKWLALDPEKLYVTVHSDDEEAREIWEEKIGLPKEHVLDEDENFWDIGVGPSGPQTEIFYDRGPENNDLPADHPESYPGGENERWLEIWNLVFSQFNHLPDDTYEPLPNKNIDTGMGLERIVSVIQDTPTNFETDLFMPLIRKVEEISGVEYETAGELKQSFKVIADHIRAVTFAIADGALPSNEGRGYVLRRLIRRAVMHGRKLEINKPFLTELVPVVGEIMGDFYPNVITQEAFVIQVIQQEENRFHETLTEGLEHLVEVFEQLTNKGEVQVTGKDAFLLYDTFGFPVELTEEYAQERGFTTDIEGFSKEMEKQRERARAARGDDQSMKAQSGVLSELEVDSEFVGYTDLKVTSRLQAIICEDIFVDEVDGKRKAQLVFETTPFYAEKGGQVGDSGIIRDSDGNLVGRVVDTQVAPAGQNLHFVETVEPLKVGDEYRLEVNILRRMLIERNHTATHLLHQALKDVVGQHVNQAGSLVTADYLRFDFTHLEQVTNEQLEKIENIINEKIWEAHPVETTVTTIDKAREMGAMALFGEKYGDVVRVVSIDDYSIELCGGTHVKNTSDIGLFKITTESGIGAGVRRIVARTSEGAMKWVEDQLEILSQTAQLTKAQTIERVTERVKSLFNELQELRRENESLYARLANEQASNLFDDPETIGGFTIIAEQVEAKDMDQLRQMADKWKANNSSDVLVLALTLDGKVNMLTAMSDKALSSGLKAGDLIKQIAPKIGGGGGGRPEMAQAGGKNPAGIQEALKTAKEWLMNV